MGQTSQGIPNDGQTAHYQISYDTSLSAADGLRRAQGLFHQCEFDFDLMTSWFKGVNFEFSFPISVQINNASGGASWDDPPNISLPFGYSPTVSINPGSGTSVDFIRYLLVSEVTEMFMASKDNGWFEDTSLFSGANEGSKGEGLSRFLGFQFKVANGLQNVRYSSFEVVYIWLNSKIQPPDAPPGPRPNYVDNNPDDIKPDIITGCTTCFLYYLHNQLGFSITDIINAGAATLGGVYRNLTGRNDGWQSFINLLNAHYPPGPTYNPAGDNLFPVPNLANLSGDQIVSGSTQTRRILSLDTQAPAEVSVFFTSDNPAVLSVPGQVNFAVGDWAAGVNLTAAPVTGPAQTVTIQAAYAGKILSAGIQILPSPSIIEGQVTDPALNGINDAMILIKSDTIILPGFGNTLQLSTDAHGFYHTQSIPPHVYQVSASNSASVPVTATVTVREGVPITRQDFVLERAKPFTIGGRVTDTSGSPIAGATITLFDPFGFPAATTDGSGNYSFSMNPGPYNGNYTITASATGYVPSSITRTIPNGATITENFVLTALGSLAGFIGDASKTPITPVAGAILTVGTLQAVSDASGRYTLSGLMPGTNDVKLTASGFDTAEVSVTVVSGVTTTQNFLLAEATAMLTGTVSNSDTDAPLPGATVRVAGAGSTSTAVDGTYTISGIRAGQAQVTVSHLGFFTENTLVQFKDHQIVEMDFPMERHIIGHEGSTRKPPGVPWPDTTMLASTKAGKRGAQRPMGRRRARL
jgi:hypothetical protein